MKLPGKTLYIKELFVDFVLRCIIMVLTRSMSSIFREHQLLYCKTIKQYLMLDVDVRKEEGKPNVDKSKQWGKNIGIFCRRLL